MLHEKPMHPITERCVIVWEVKPSGGLSVKHFCERGGEYFTAPDALENLESQRRGFAKQLAKGGFYPSFSEAQKAITVVIKLFKKNHRKFEDHI